MKEFAKICDKTFNTISETDSSRRKPNRKDRYPHCLVSDRKMEESSTEEAIKSGEQHFEPDINLLYSNVTDYRSMKLDYANTNTTKEVLSEADNDTNQHIPETGLHINQDQLSRYRQADPIRVRPFECVDCGKRFKHRHHLQYHSRQHSGDKPFVCDVCFKSFSQLSNMYTHRRRRHALEIGCEACGRIFTNPKKLKYHLCDLTMPDKD